MKSCSSSASTSSTGDTSSNTEATEDEKEGGGICSLYCLASCLSVPTELGFEFLPHKNALVLSGLTTLSDGAFPFLRVSTFDNVPPTILFYTKGTKVKKPSPHFASQLTWCNNSLLALVVRHSLAASHFKLVDESKKWVGYWGRHLKSVQYKTLKPFQKVNHFPGAFHLGRKDRLWLHIYEFMQLFEGDLFCIMPVTYVLPRDAKKLRIYLAGQTNRHVILKPPASARGTGISIVSRFDSVPTQAALVAQHYIERPFIINGAKFDLRIYVYVTSYDPLRVYIYDEGLVRFASVAYSSAMSSYSNHFIHLTNYSINKHASSDEPVPKWRLSEFWSFLDANGHNSSRLRDDINLVALKAIVSCESYIRSHASLFSDYSFVSHELYGMDILVDANLRPWLIEMNISPSLHSSTSLDVSVKAQLARDVLNMCGVPFPICSDDDFDSSLYFRTRNFTAHKTEKHLKKEQKHLENFVSNAEISDDILEDLTDADLRILVEFEDEFSRRGAFLLIYPSADDAPHSLLFLRCMKSPLYSNLLLFKWQSLGTDERTRSIGRLRELCSLGIHIAKEMVDEEEDNDEEEEGKQFDEENEDQQQKQDEKVSDEEADK